MGIALVDGDVAYRCNLVTVVDGVMVDFSAGHITSADGAALLDALQPAVPSVRVVPGISYRNLLVVPGGAGGRGTPPHDIVGEPIGPYLPVGPDRDLLLACMAAAERSSPTTRSTAGGIAAGKAPATGIWPWSGGRRPALPPFTDLFGASGGMISAVDLLNGIARYAGLEVIAVPGATGYLDTDYDGKARAALAALDRLDFVYCHVEAPDEAGHMGSVEEKVRAIERVDGMLGIAPRRLRRRRRRPARPRDAGAAQDAYAPAGAGGRPRPRHGRHAPLLGARGGEGRPRAARSDGAPAAPARAAVDRHQPPCIITGQWG